MYLGTFNRYCSFFLDVPWFVYGMRTSQEFFSARGHRRCQWGRGITFYVLILVTMQLYADSDFDREQIQQRISPVGNVHTQAPTESTNAVPSSSQTIPTAAIPKNPGQAIYEQYCVVCHRDGVAGAPKFREMADWSSRLAKQDMDSLTMSAIKGLNAMPAKGTCQECTDKDIKAAIEYMVPHS